MSYKQWTSYNPDGSVESVFRGSEPTADELAGRDFVPGAADAVTQFVDVTKPLKRAWDKQPCPHTIVPGIFIADGVDELEISGLPDPCVVVWPDGVKTEVIGGSIQYSVDYPGTYTFKLSSPIHLETGVSVEAIAVS